MRRRARQRRGVLLPLRHGASAPLIRRTTVSDRPGSKSPRRCSRSAPQAGKRVVARVRLLLALEGRENEFSGWNSTWSVSSRASLAKWVCINEGIRSEDGPPATISSRARSPTENRHPRDPSRDHPTWPPPAKRADPLIDTNPSVGFSFGSVFPGSCLV
jgi:hypothetical protein